MPDGDEVLTEFDLDEHPTGRRAGLRPDERDPDEPRSADGAQAGASDRHMQGAPAGGSASGGLAGTNSGDGSTDDVDIESGHGVGIDDDSGDRDFSENEPASGISGGAVGGTPANKRAEPSTRGRGIHPASGHRGGDGGTIGSPPDRSATPQ
jgi:hypothetical protein